MQPRSGTVPWQPGKCTVPTPPANCQRAGVCSNRDQHSYSTALGAISSPRLSLNGAPGLGEGGCRPQEKLIRVIKAVTALGPWH